MPSVTASLAFFTSDLPGIGGVIKQRPDDFMVEELPLYEPCGEGEHVYLFIEKRNMTTMQVADELARRLHVRRGDVSYAGMKDKAAVTRQLFSAIVPIACDLPDRLAPLKGAPFGVLWTDRHRNKLKRGHLAGNRFVIRIRQVQPHDVIAAKRILDRAMKCGVPNYFTDQRFGMEGNNHELGKAMLLGERKPDGNPTRRDLMLSALQSAMFNQVVDRRLREGAFDKLLDGDLAYKHDSGAVFDVDAATAEAENAPGGRVASRQISPSAPMWGSRMTRPRGLPLQWELDALVAMGLTEQHLEGQGRIRLTGERRPIRLFPGNADIAGGVDEHGPYIKLSFDLDPGSYATAVLREIMKADVGAAGEAGGK